MTIYTDFKFQFQFFFYSVQDTNIVTTGGTYMISKYVSIIVVKFTMGEQQKIGKHTNKNNKRHNT